MKPDLFKNLLKPIAISTVVGVLEILLVVQLHQMFTAWQLVGLYLFTTVLGVALVMYVGFPTGGFNGGKKARKRIEKKLKSKEPLTEQESKQFTQELQGAVLVISLTFVIIPGLLTDIFGLLLLLPFSSEWIKKKMEADLLAPSPETDES